MAIERNMKVVKSVNQIAIQIEEKKMIRQKRKLEAIKYRKKIEDPKNYIQRKQLLKIDKYKKIGKQNRIQIERNLIGQKKQEIN